MKWTNALVMFTEKELMEFLNVNFPTRSLEVIKHELGPLWHSPFDLELLIRVAIDWLDNEDGTQGRDPTGKESDEVEQYISQNYKQDNTNRWFFSLLPYVADPTARVELLERYNYPINPLHDINTSKACLADIIGNNNGEGARKYEKRQLGKLIHGLRGVIGFVFGRWYIKHKKEGQYYLEVCGEGKFQEQVQHFHPIKGKDKWFVHQIIFKYFDYFTYNEVKLSATNEPGVVNLFQGLKYAESASEDFTPLKGILDHILTVNCNRDKAKFEYLKKWIASILIKITVKNCTMPILHGVNQGAGKSFAIELVCELLGCYALYNVDDWEKFFGKFNGPIALTLLVVMNEPAQAGERFKWIGRIKSKLTQKKVMLETKGKDQIQIDAWTNYMAATNNDTPVKEEMGDRRLIYFKTNDEYIGNEEYFKRVFTPFQPEVQGPYVPEMMGLLLHYFRTQVDISDFNPERMIREINANTQCPYNEQLDRQYLDAKPVERYIIDHAEEFQKGIVIDKAFVTALKEEDEGNAVNITKIGIARTLNTYCDSEQMRQKTLTKKYPHINLYDCKEERPRVYKLKSEEQIPCMYNIIKYKQYKSPEEVADEAAEKAAEIREVVK
jgi:hypothetical protein